MPTAKIATSLPKDQKHERLESLQTLLRDLIEQYGEPSAEDVEWAERALEPRKR